MGYKKNEVIPRDILRDRKIPSGRKCQKYEHNEGAVRGHCKGTKVTFKGLTMKNEVSGKEKKRKNATQFARWECIVSLEICSKNIETDFWFKTGMSQGKMLFVSNWVDSEKSSYYNNSWPTAPIGSGNTATWWSQLTGGRGVAFLWHPLSGLEYSLWKVTISFKPRMSLWWREDC